MTSTVRERLCAECLHLAVRLVCGSGLTPRETRRLATIRRALDRDELQRLANEVVDLVRSVGHDGQRPGRAERRSGARPAPGAQ